MIALDNSPRHFDRPSRREFLERVLGSGGAFAVAPSFLRNSKTMASAKQSAERLKWRAHSVAGIPHGYQVAVADVNGDGRPDILALSSAESVVEWYENPSWEARAITTRTKSNISLAPLVWKGYVGHGLALASDFHLGKSTEGGSVWWAAPSRAPDAEWELDLIASIPTAHRLRWADLDGDGRPELLVVPLLGAGARAPDYSVGAPITWYRIPDVLWSGEARSAKDEPAMWAPRLIDDSLTVVHGVLVYDWDGDGRDEFLTASFEGVHLFRSTGRGENLRWQKTHLASGDQASGPKRGSSEIGVGKVGGRRFLATIEPWHGNQVAVYLPGESGALWDRHVIDPNFREGHALVCADLDGDGSAEIVAGYRGPGTSLFIYHAQDASGRSWERQLLDADMAASGVVIADVNDDGRPDIVAVGSSTGNVKWYENRG
jgi:Aldos-2-ulose dehydratase, beta-propeller domain/FG-GAP-like repeat/FG-GAP repeat